MSAWLAWRWWEVRRDPYLFGKVVVCCLFACPVPPAVTLIAEARLILSTLLLMGLFRICWALLLYDGGYRMI